MWKCWMEEWLIVEECHHSTPILHFCSFLGSSYSTSMVPTIFLFLFTVLRGNTYTESSAFFLPIQGIFIEILINKGNVFHWRDTLASVLLRTKQERYTKGNLKTPSPKCRLYWGLLEFADWRYSQSCWYFRPALWSIVPLTFSLVSSPPPPLSCVNKYTVHSV
jgi:hypothetical protein